MLAGIISFYIYRFEPWSYGYWVVGTVAAVARPGLTDTFGKMITRVFGTLIGCGMAVLLLA